MRTTNLLQWAAGTLLGHVVASAVGFSLPLCIVFLDLNYQEGTLNPAWALWIVSMTGLLGLVFAVLFWYSVTRPLIKRRNDRM
jgi:hypothetical protein